MCMTLLMLLFLLLIVSFGVVDYYVVGVTVFTVGVSEDVVGVIGGRCVVVFAGISNVVVGVNVCVIAYRW